MTLPASGEMSFNDIHLEAGGSTGTECSLDDADIRALIGESAGTEHSVSEWYGASSESIGVDWGLTAYNWSDTTSNEAESDYAQVLVGVNNNGRFYRRVYDNGAQTDTFYDWCTSAPSTTGSNYEVKYTQTGTTVSTNQTATNTFEDLGTSRYYALTDAVPNNSDTTAAVTITIRKDGDAGSEVSQTFNFTASFGSGIAWTSTADTVGSSGIGSTNPAGMKLLNDGNSEETNFSGTYVGWTDWSTNPAGTGMDATKYEVFWNRISGDVLDVKPTEDAWLDLGTSRTWQFNGGGSSNRTAVIDVTVRCDSQPGSAVTKRVTIQQTYEP